MGIGAMLSAPPVVIVTVPPTDVISFAAVRLPPVVITMFP
jgi:hypothetical protein